MPSIIDDLLARGWAWEDRIGIGDRSLGGNMAYTSVLAETRVRVAASVASSPE